MANTKQNQEKAAQSSQVVLPWFSFTTLGCPRKNNAFRIAGYTTHNNLTPNEEPLKL